MSKVQLQGNANGTGIFTIASPNSNIDRTVTLPDATGTVQVSGNPISGTTGTFTGLLDISAAGAGQIQFPATQSASSDANTLDDYEEGTFTPTLNFNGNSTGITYGGQIGTYTKIGNTVRVFATIQLTSKGSAGGVVGMTGFPFSNVGSNNGNPVAAIYGQLSSVTSQIIPYISGTSVTFEVLNTGSQSGLLNTNVNNNSAFYVSITYQTS